MPVNFTKHHLCNRFYGGASNNFRNSKFLAPTHPFYVGWARGFKRFNKDESKILQSKTSRWTPASSKSSAGRWSNFNKNNYNFRPSAQRGEKLLPTPESSGPANVSSALDWVKNVSAQYNKQLNANRRQEHWLQAISAGRRIKERPDRRRPMNFPAGSGGRGKKINFVRKERLRRWSRSERRALEYVDKVTGERFSELKIFGPLQIRGFRRWRAVLRRSAARGYPGMLEREEFDNEEFNSFEEFWDYKRHSLGQEKVPLSAGEDAFRLSSEESANFYARSRALSEVEKRMFELKYGSLYEVNNEENENEGKSYLRAINFLNRRLLRVSLDDRSFVLTDQRSDVRFRKVSASTRRVFHPVPIDRWFIEKAKRKFVRDARLGKNIFGRRILKNAKIHKRRMRFISRKKNAWLPFSPAFYKNTKARRKGRAAARSLINKSWRANIFFGSNRLKENEEILEHLATLNFVMKAYFFASAYLLDYAVDLVAHNWNEIEGESIVGGTAYPLSSLVARYILDNIITSYKNRSRPFISTGHILWLDEVIRNFNRRADRRGRERLFARSNAGLINSVLFSRQLFFNDTSWEIVGRVRKHALNFIANYYFMRQSVAQLRSLHEKKELHSLKRWMKYRWNKWPFIINRDRRQLAQLGLMMQEGLLIKNWNLTQLLSSATSFNKLSVWEPRTRVLVRRIFPLHVDPFADSRPIAKELFHADKVNRSKEKIRISPFKAVDAFEKTAANYKRGSIIFSAFLAKALSKVIARAALPRAGNTQDYLIGLEEKCKKFLLGSFHAYFETITREHRSVLADFSLVLRTISTIRFFPDKTRRVTVGDPVMRHWIGSQGGMLNWSRLSNKTELPKTSTSTFSNWYKDPFMIYGKSQFPLRMRIMLSKYVRIMTDPRTSAFVGNSAIPRSYMFLDDYNKNNFTRYNAGNPTAFVKFICDSILFLGEKDIYALPQARVIQYIIKNLSRLMSRYDKLRKFRATLASTFIKKDRGLYSRNFFRKHRGFFKFARAKSFKAAKRLAVYTGRAARGHLWSIFKKSSPLFTSGFSGASEDIRSLRALYEQFVEKEYRLGFESKNRRNKLSDPRYLALKKMTLRRAGYFLTSYLSGLPVDPLFSKSNLKMSVRSLFHKAYVLRYRTIPRSVSLNYHHYYFRHLWVQRVREHLVSISFKKGKVGKKLALENVNTMFKKYMRIAFRQPKWHLFKRNPEAVGRSRIFFYLQKKPKPARKFSRASNRFIFTYMPPIRLTSRSLTAMGLNEHLLARFATRLSHRRVFRYKFMLRHAACAYWRLRTSNLLHKWNSIQKTGRKWFTWYDKFESHLCRYLVASRLVPGKRYSIDAIKSGLVFVNGFICVNPFYKVKPGDIIVLNNEFYWTYLTKQLAWITKKYLRPLRVGAAARRAFLKRALKMVQRQYAAGSVRASLGPRDRQRFEVFRGMFRRDAAFDKTPKKALAPGGSDILRGDIYLADINKFTMDPVPSYNASSAKYERAIGLIFKRLETSAFNNAELYYRFHNAVYVRRLPNSPEEYFSRSKVRTTKLFNPYVIRFMLSHRFWH